MSPSDKPFDEERYKALMDGLECSEITISQVRQYEPFRIDSHFFEKKYRRLKNTLETLSCAQLKDLVTKSIQTGHTPSMTVDSYYGGSIALIKTDNLHDNNIGTLFSDHLTAEGNAVISRTSLASKDIITTIIGATEQIIARSAIVTEEYLPANINQNIVQIRINPQKAAPEYVNTYLNTKYGKQYLIYMSRQTEQYNLNCKEVESVLVPNFSNQFQKEIVQVVNKAQACQSFSRQCYQKAEAVLAAVLDIQTMEQERPVLSVKPISESFLKSGRLDAEYYQPKYDEYRSIITNYKNGYSIIRVEFLPIRDICNRRLAEYQYVEIGDVDISTGSASYNTIATDDLPDNAKVITQKEDIIVSTVRPNRGAVAILEDNDLLVSGAFTVLRERGPYKKEVLQVLLRLPLYRDWLLRYNVGTSYPVIKDDDVLNMPIPLFQDAVQKEIAAKVQESFALRRQSKQLLEYAKQAVEMAIETNEATALHWLELQSYKGE